jgi:hypothetical protein
MLARIGKSLILATIFITAVMAISPNRATIIPRDWYRGETWQGGDQIAIIYVVLGSTIAFITVLLVSLAIRGRSIGGELGREVKDLRTSTRNGEPKYLEAKPVISPVEALYSSGPHPTEEEPHRKTGNWSVEPSLVGNTLRTYWSLLCKRDNPIGLRAIQRELGFSSPSSAVYQLEKLIRLGLVQKDDMGDYIVRRVTKVGFLRYFFFVGGYPLPRSAIYGSLSLLIDVACFAVLIGLQVQISVAGFASLPGLFSSSIFWYDAMRIFRYRQRLIEKDASRYD